MFVNIIDFRCIEAPLFVLYLIQVCNLKSVGSGTEAINIIFNPKSFGKVY